MDLRALLGALAAMLALISYVPYIRDVWRRRTRPHTVSWLVWSVLAGAACAVQTQGGGTSGAWALAVTAVVCGLVFTMALVWGERRITAVDKFSLAFAGCSLVAWLATDNVLAAAVCITLTDAVGGFVPTFRKSYDCPEQETATTYGINAVAFVLSIAALGDLSLANILYPAALVVLNGGLAWLLLWRRRNRWLNPSFERVQA